MAWMWSASYGLRLTALFMAACGLPIGETLQLYGYAVFAVKHCR